jgi:hypothetical protein
MREPSDLMGDSIAMPLVEHGRLEGESVQIYEATASLLRPAFELLQKPAAHAAMPMLRRDP